MSTLRSTTEINRTVTINTGELRPSLQMSVSSRIIRSLFRSAGFDITRFDNRSVQTEHVWLDEFGGKQDAFLDIKRLSHAWNWDIKVFFDVGANDGATAKAAVSHLPGARIFAFEPHPQTFVKLRDNISGPAAAKFVVRYCS